MTMTNRSINSINNATNPICKGEITMKDVTEKMSGLRIRLIAVAVRNATALSRAVPRLSVA